MTSFNNRSTSFPVIPSLLVMNMFPLVGVLFFNWNFFAIIYLYWWETVILSFFNVFKMLSAKKEADADPGFKVNNQPLTKEKANSRAFLLPFYVGTRVFTLFIYLVFILVFIGMHKVPASGMVSSVEIIFFKNDFMRISFGIIVLYYLADFLTYRWSGLNEETTMKELAVPFDGRSIVMHVVIVLGAVSTAFLGERLFGSEQKAAPILFAGFFVVVKTLVDLFAAKAKMEREEMVWRKIWNKE